MKLTGTLKLERKTISVLSIIGIFAIVIACVLEYIVPRFVVSEIFEKWHPEFLSNALLGISCSAIISLLCLLFPYWNNKNKQYLKLIQLVRNLYYSYEQLFNTINSNGNIDRNDKSYLGEIHLIESANKLENSVIELIEEYNTDDILLENVEEIIRNTTSVFIPIIQITEDFAKKILPPRYTSENDVKSLFEQNQFFDCEENHALYNELLLALTNIMSREDVEKMFIEYIDPEKSNLEILKHSTKLFLQRAQLNRTQTNTYNTQTLLSKKINDIRNEFSNKKSMKNVDILVRIKALKNKISLFTDEEKKFYHNATITILEELKKEEYDTAEELLEKLEEKLKLYI